MIRECTPYNRFESLAISLFIPFEQWAQKLTGGRSRKILQLAESHTLLKEMKSHMFDLRNPSKTLKEMLLPGFTDFLHERLLPRHGNFQYLHIAPRPYLNPELLES